MRPAHYLLPSLVQDQYFFIYEAIAEAIVCGDTEVSLERLSEYVAELLLAAEDQPDNLNIELEFKVHQLTLVHVLTALTFPLFSLSSSLSLSLSPPSLPPTEAGSRQVRSLPIRCSQ